jgi:hypothetical protein
MEIAMSQDQSGSDEPTPQHPSNFLREQHSRRKFLRAAVASGAAVAAVGAAGVAAANASPQLLRQIRGEPATASGQGEGTMCFESSAFGPITEFDVFQDGHRDVKTNPGTFFVWFTVQHLPAGTYNYTLTPTPGDATTPFRLSDPGNNVYVLPVADGSATNPCPTADPDPSPPANQVGHSIGAPLFPFTTGSLGTCGSAYTSSIPAQCLLRPHHTHV